MATTSAPSPDPHLLRSFLPMWALGSPGNMGHKISGIGHVWKPHRTKLLNSFQSFPPWSPPQALGKHRARWWMRSAEWPVASCTHFWVWSRSLCLNFFLTTLQCVAKLSSQPQQISGRPQQHLIQKKGCFLYRLVLKISSEEDEINYSLIPGHYIIRKLLWHQKDSEKNWEG